MIRKPLAVSASVLSLMLVHAAASAQAVKKDVPYVPTPPEVVNKMLTMAEVGEEDVVYDLGCGDGRIVISAVKDHKAERGVGVDIDPERIRESRLNAKEANVEDKVKFTEGNLFEMDFKEADVLAIYLLPSVNLQLRPKILKEMKPGSRVVSHAFDMGDWEPDETANVEHRTVYKWVVPAKVEGTHEVSLKTDEGEKDAKLDLQQKYQKVTGTVTIDGKEHQIADGTVRGREITFRLTGDNGQSGQGEYSLTLNDDGDLSSDARLASDRQGNDDKSAASQHQQQQDDQDQQPTQESGSNMQ